MTTRTGHRDRGMALVFAIGMLMIFVLLGTAYVGYMSVEFEEAGIELHDIRARNLASAGVYAAIGEIQLRLAESGTPEPEYALTLSAYRREIQGAGAYPQRVNVAVTDESARVNLNLAPPALLRAMGFSEDAVAKLSNRQAEKRRLTSVDSLRVDSILDAQEFAALDPDTFTVYTGHVGGDTRGHLNLNTASPRVLSAVFAISLEEAQALAEKRPFTDWADVLQKVGREPATFNLDVPRFAPRQQPGAVALTSRCYRLRSAATLDMPGGSHRPVYAAVEAVVVFDENGGYAIRYWRELRGADASAANASTTGAGQAAAPAGAAE